MDLQKIIPKDAETTLEFFVNGKKVLEHHPDPEWTLLWYLRKKLDLTGTKYGCGEGGCGACTVMLSHYIKHEDRVKHIAVNACLTPVCAVHGMAVTTIEGIGSTRDKLHPVQERMAKCHGSQCGFCTPGIVMSMYTLLRNKHKIDYTDIETSMQGNLCRCTGYRPIIEGFKTFTEVWESRCVNGSNNFCMMGEECCKLKNTDNSELFSKSYFQPYDPTQEPIFPPELKLNERYEQAYLYFRGDCVTWVRPKELCDILAIKAHFPQSKIVVGNTEVGVEMKLKKLLYSILISPKLIHEMGICTSNNHGITIGATTSLSDILCFIQNSIQKKTEENKFLKALHSMLYWFAGTQVRNVASLVGNIITASPISDLNPILMACGAVINVSSLTRGHRRLIIDETFFKSYRKTALEDDEIVTSVELPFSKRMQFLKAYKQARRREDDISIVTAAFYIQFEDNNNIVNDAKLCFGGMAPTTICAVETSKLLKGLQWDQNMLNKAFESLIQEMQLTISTPGGMADYRKSLCLSLFFRFFLYVSQKINNNKILDTEMSGVDQIFVNEPESAQYFEIKSRGGVIQDSVGKPIPHVSAFKQATGEAIYCDDIPQVRGELFLTLVLSSKPHAKIISIDASKALSVPGVTAFFSATDLEKKCNQIGSIVKDEEIFSSELVTSRSCVIGAIVAETEIIARKARDLISVTYETLEPVIITLEDAIDKQSFFPGYPQKITKGDVNKALNESEMVLEGRIRSGAQEHFYLETMSAFAIKKEDELEIIATSQSPAEIAHIASHALNIPNHKVVAKVKRIGGGFGGKETRNAIIAIPVAIAAYKLNKPIRAVLDRDEDMQITGYRHPYLVNYKVGFTKNGKIKGVIYHVYANAGNSLDISCAMIDRAMFHMDNCYFIENIEVNVYLCRTNTPSNTAFRGFGAPQAMFAVENMIRDIALSLSKSYEEIVETNLYKEGDFTHFNQMLTHCTLSRCWNECILFSNYWDRRSEVFKFNRQNRWKKKGISLVPTKYGISFQSDVLMQAGALVLVYTDGSVLLSIGGIEMGQGLFTKMIQVCSRALDIDINKIHISEMGTDKVPNSSPTAASISSDLYGMAVINACNILKDRLVQYKTRNPDGEWEDWVSAAYADRVNLSATGFYSAPKIKYDRKTNSGDLYEYFTYGVACSEVIVDCLTGDHQVLRTDIVMDVGESLNPAIDIGQIEGAFLQGYGFFTLEEMVFSPSGEVLSRGPGAYKIPGFSDVPKSFNVSLLKGAPNPRAVYSSKAVGEPPLFLAASVFFAIKEAIRSARLDAGESSEFTLDAPATCYRIRMACEDHITKQVKPTIGMEGVPWNVIA